MPQGERTMPIQAVNAESGVDDVAHDSTSENAVPEHTPIDIGSYAAPKEALFESFDYFIDQPVHHGATIPKGPSGGVLNANTSRYSPRTVVLVRWSLTLLAAVTIGLLRGLILIGAHWIYHGRLAAMIYFLNQESPELSVLMWIVIGVGAVSVIAFLVAYVEPLAGGSGIPDVKAYLNGVLIPRLLRFNACFLRVVGQMVVVGVGFFAGSEGPMAHLGAIVGAAVAEMHVHNRFYLKALMPFSSHRIKYDFISIGTAMGVATAFQAPLGGLLFSLEEASTYWSAETTWRAFFGCTVASYITKLASQYFTCTTAGSCVNLGGMMQFPDPGTTFFHMWEVLPFILLGAFFGVLGALFNAGVKLCQSTRRKWFRLYTMARERRRFMRVLEVVAVMLVTIVVSFAMAWSVQGSCRPLAGQDFIANDGIQTAFCEQREGGGYYNPLSAILLADRDTSIRWLFSPALGESEYPIMLLVVAACVIIPLTLLTYGLAIPSGLFIPNIMIGACLGRAFGLCMGSSASSPGVYAAVGAAGMLAGFSRMTVSLTAIVVEITGDLRMLPAIMLGVITAKQVGDMFNKGAYDIVLMIRKVPFLEELNLYDEKHMRGKDITYRMAPAPLVTFASMESLARVQSVLSGCGHNAFVVEDCGRLLGLVSRAVIMEHLINNQACAPDHVDILRLADPCPMTVREDFPLARGYAVFRQLGLRHLLVVSEDDSDRVVGIVTRKDLHEALEVASSPMKVAMSQVELSSMPGGPKGSMHSLR